MTIWFLDVYNKITKSVGSIQDVFTSNLIQYYDASGLNDIPTPQEFNLIFIDFMNASTNQLWERKNRLKKIEEQTGVPQPKGIYHFNPAAEKVYEYAQKVLTPRLREALDFGIPVVVIAGKVHIRNDNNNYEWLLELFDTLEVIERRPEIGPATTLCVSSDRAVKDLYEEFQNDLAWEVGFNNPIEPLRVRYSQLWLGRKQNNETDLPIFITLFENAKNQPVSFSLSIGKSELLVLPNIEDIERRSNYIKYIFEEFLPQFRPEWFPGKWAGYYTPTFIQREIATMQAEKERVLKEFQSREEIVETKKKELLTFMDLVTQADDRLVVAVERVLNDIFRIAAINLDIERDQQNKPRLVDLIAQIEDKRLAIEIKGSKRSLKKEMLNKTETNVRTYQNEYPDKTIDGIVLILNDQLQKEPKDREPYALHMIEEAEQRGITILSTPVLLELMAMYLSGDLNIPSLAAILCKPGIVAIN